MILATLLLLATVVVLTIYFWPLRKSELQKGTSETISFDQALTRYESVESSERQARVVDECGSKLYSHGERTAKSVVMFHGITACPKQFAGLAQTFYDAGYNVYVPKAPHHGFADKRRHGQVRSKELVDFVNSSVTIATGLGDTTGAVGLSGGGMLTTWAAEYRPEITSALVLSPFYEPAPAQAPKWQLPFLNVLYGLHVLPDKFVEPSSPDGAAFSYSALGNYNIITKNLKKDPSGLPLKSFSTIISADDDQIDLALAKSIPQKIADANPSMKFARITLPGNWELGHDIVSLENKNVAARSQQLFPLYLDAYEGEAGTSEFTDK